MTDQDIKLSKFVTSYFLGEQEKVDPRFFVEEINKGKDKKSLKEGDIFFGSINTTIKVDGKKRRENNRKDVYQVLMIDETQGTTTIKLRDFSNEHYKTSRGSLVIFNETVTKSQIMDCIIRAEKGETERKAKELEREVARLGFSLKPLKTEDRLERLYAMGIRNAWMVGPAGCGKSTMARNFAEAKGLPYLCISCSIGTSATEFVGYKYPTREGTSFAALYAKPSVLLIDEMPALDPSVAQVLNAALANDEIETTTGLVRRHKDCLIIATSNTYGRGADRQYVANNQLDSSTIDRFVGGILEVDYSKEYEERYDKEVVEYVNNLRNLIKANSLRRIASTRMVESGHKLKFSYVTDWKQVLIQDWGASEIEIVKKEGLW